MAKGMGCVAFITIWLAFTILTSIAAAQDGSVDAQKAKAYAIIEQNKEVLAKMSDVIYSYSEPGFQEFKTSELLVNLYRKAGFQVEQGVAGMPTAFVGTWGSGKPVFALMADYDAQLTSSQKPAVVRYDPIVEGAPGHGEGHNTNPMVVYGAAIALKSVMEQFGLKGTIKVIGGPAEEVIASRGFMVKAGVWRDVDVAMDAHISRSAAVKYGMANVALVSAVFTFNGEAEEFPFIRRNAVSAMELFNTGMRYLQDRMPGTAKGQYIITGGGDSPNIVTREASAWYYFRDRSAAGAMNFFEEAKKVAQGAAMMSGTRLDARIRTAAWPLNQNKALSELTHKNMVAIGLPKWSEEDHAFFRAFQKAFRATPVGVNYEIDSKLQATTPITASSDAGDVTWVVPSTRLEFPGQLFIRGEAASQGVGRSVLNHQWTQAVSPATPVAHKGILFGAKVMAATFIDIFSNPDNLKKIQADFAAQTKGVSWKSMIPDDAKPPLDVNKFTMEKYRPSLEKFYYDPNSPKSYLETLNIKYPPAE